MLLHNNWNKHLTIEVEIMSNNKLQLRHGRVTDPQTRGLVATDLGLIAEWENNEMEG